jgi:Neuraminidase (sialidase)
MLLNSLYLLSLALLALGMLLIPTRVHAQAGGPEVTVEGGVTKIRLLPPKEGNPRNSEGDFVQLKDGRVLLVYTHFTGGGGDNSAAHLAGRYSSDGGRTWTTEDVVVVPNEGGCNVMSVSLLRLQSGEIALFYLRKNSMEDCRPYLRLSTDEGQTWSEPTLCIPPVGYYVVNNDRVIQLRNGRLVVPAALHNIPGGKWGPGVAMCFLSDDNGKTWYQSDTELQGPENSRSGLQEPGVIELKDGRLMMLCRTDQGCQMRSYSADSGITWSPAEPTNLLSPVSPATFERIPQTGDILLAWNDHTHVDDAHRGKRTPFRVAISRDEGQTWENVKTLEDDPAGWYCYTAMEFVGDHVLLAYCATGAGMPHLSRTQITLLDVDWLYQ